MAQCDIPTLLNRGKCFECLTPGQRYPIKLALLCAIAQQSNPSLDCSPNALLKKASCLVCLPYPMLYVLKLQLLCNILGGIGGGGGGTPVIPPKAPGAPTNFTASAQGPPMVLNWILADATADRIEIWSNFNGNAFTLLASTGGNQTTYTDMPTGIPADGGTFCYMVRACNVIGCSAFSNIACSTVPGPT